MKKLLLIPALLLCGCGANYSNGTRVGIITKLSQKGVIFKSWEGELLVSLPSGATTTPEKFEFNVAPEAVGKVEAAMNSGARVELVYHQWWISPPSIDNDHVVIDVRDSSPHR